MYARGKISLACKWSGCSKHLADCGILYLLIHSKSSGDVSGGVGFGVTRQPSPVLTLSSSRCRSAGGTKSISERAVTKGEVLALVLARQAGINAAATRLVMYISAATMLGVEATE